MKRAEQGLPLLFGHDPDRPIGIVERIRVSNNKLRGVLRFGASTQAREVFEDVRAGILKNLSIGYSIDAEPKAIGERDYLITRWTPLECSVVAIAADHTIGIGRGYKSSQEEDNMSKPSEPLDAKREAFTPRADSADKERERVVEIQTLGQRFKCEQEAAQAIREGTSVPSFREWVLSKQEETKAPAFDPCIGMTEREVDAFSFRNLILATATNDWKEAGLEREAVRAAGPGSHGGFLIPVDVLRAPMTRAIGTTSTQSNVVPTDHLSGSFIDFLRDRTIVRNLGATVLAGLVGDVSIPKQSASATVAWVGEGDNLSESILGTAAVTLSPKSVGAYSDFTRRLMLQSDPTVEGLIRNDLAGAVAVAIDSAAFNGAGGDEPTGILTVSGVSQVSLTSNELTWAKVIELETTVAGNNADVGSLAYATNSQVRGFLKSKEKTASTGIFVWPDQPLDSRGFGRLNGYPAAVSNIIPSNLGGGSNKSAVIFGDFSSLLLGEWSTIEIAVDPYALFQSGGIRVRVFADVDVAVRRTESFAKVTDAATS